MWYALSAIGSGIEAVITALTRNQVYQQWYRGFESHPLRQLRGPLRCAVPSFDGDHAGQGASLIFKAMFRVENRF